MAREKVLGTHSANVIELEASNFSQGRHQALQGVMSIGKGLELRKIPRLQREEVSRHTDNLVL